MKRTKLLAILLAVFAIAAPARAADWGDEFDGTAGSPPDAAKWNIETGSHGFGGNELQTYTNKPENIQQDGAGSLKITALKTAAGGYTSARVHTQGKFAYRTGTLEWRMKMSRMAQGLGPSIWTVGGFSSDWPKKCEVDILELFLDPVRFTNTVICADLNDPTLPVGGSSNWPMTNAEGWHVYRLDRTNDRLKFYLDGIQARDIGKDTFAQWKLDLYDHFLLANIAVGGDRPWGPPNASTPLPATMQIDYVRWWATIQPAPSPVVTVPGETTGDTTTYHTVAVIPPASATTLPSKWSKDGTSIFTFSPSNACWTASTEAIDGELWVDVKNQNNGSLGIPAGYAFHLDATVDGAAAGNVNIPGSTTADQTGKLPIPFTRGQHQVCLAWTNDAWQSGSYDANLRIDAIAIVSKEVVTTPPPAPEPTAAERAKAKLTGATWQALTEDEAAAVVNP